MHPCVKSQSANSLAFRSLLALGTVLFGACGPVQDEPHYVDHDIGELTDGTVGGATGCDTSIVHGLTYQLIEELDCILPNAIESFGALNVQLTPAVNPYLAPTAVTALKEAIAEKNQTLSVTSAYRTVAQQFLLYKWWQAGQCGIQIAATPGTSNHQSGRAVDLPDYTAWQKPMSDNGWTWYGPNDVVHFDYLSAKDISPDSVLTFQKLWNENNNSANQLAEDSAWGPATNTAMANSPAEGFAKHGCALGPCNLTDPILAKYNQLGRASSPLGSCVSGVSACAADAGQYANFQKGAIFTHAATGAFMITGALETLYQSLGSERSPLGFPTADTAKTADGKAVESTFEHGAILDTSAHGAIAITGAFFSVWKGLGPSGGCLGYPVSEETVVANETVQTFENGYISQAGSAAPAADCGAVFTAPDAGAPVGGIVSGGPGLDAGSRGTEGVAGGCSASGGRWGALTWLPALLVLVAFRRRSEHA
jgi:hypothetical protein